MKLIIRNTNTDFVEKLLWWSDIVALANHELTLFIIHCIADPFLSMYLYDVTSTEESARNAKVT